MNLDWTAISIAGLTSVLGIIGLVLKLAFGKVEKHMDRTEQFMVESGKNQAVMQTEIKNHDQRFAGVERWVQGIESRVNDSRRIGEIHSMVGDLHSADQERRTP